VRSSEGIRVRLQRSGPAVALFLALLALLAFGLSPTPALARDAVISGTTVDASTGQPALGVKMAAYRWFESEKTWSVQNYSYVDAAGKFSMPVEIWDAPTVLVFDGGAAYRGQFYPGVISDTTWGSWPDNLPDSEEFRRAPRLKLTADLDLGAVRMVPREAPYGAIQGTMTEQYGHPVTEMVRCWREDPDTGVWSPSYWKQASLAGYYSFIGTADAPLTGRVKLEFETLWSPVPKRSFWGGADLASGRAVTINPGEAVYGVDYEFEFVPRIHGRVMRAETKTPVGGISVEYDADGIGGHRTRSDGRYYIGEDRGALVRDHVIYAVDSAPPYWPGRYYYYGQTTKRSKARVVTPGPDEVLADRDIWLSRTEAVAGKVLNGNGAALPDITAQVYRVMADGSTKYVGSDYTDSLGMYRVLCGVVGTYTVRFVDSGGTASKGDDRAVWLGGASSAAGATRLKVISDEAAAADPFVLNLADERASRVFGMNGVDAAIAVSKDAFPAGETTSVVLASENSFADSLSGANIAGAVQGPVLFTRLGSVPKGLIEEVERLGARKIYLIGGEAVISPRQESLWKALGYEVERIGGRDRYAVNASSVIEADSLGSVSDGAPVFVTSGEVFPDAIAVSPAVYANQSVVLLVPKSGVTSNVLQAADQLDAPRLSAVGGAASLPSIALKGFQSRGISVTRVAAGSDRYDTAARFARWARSAGWLDAGHAGLATGLGFQDALVAGPALGEVRSPLLLTTPNALPATTASALTSLRSSAGSMTVSAYGATSRISSRVLAQARAR